MLKVYNGYEEKRLTGKELKDLFDGSFYCDGRHHSVVNVLPICLLLESLDIKDDIEYAIFYNSYFCKVHNARTEAEIIFFGHEKNQYSRFYKNKDISIPDCPICGKQLKLRQSQYGMFWACPDYPNCKGKESIGKFNK